MAGGRRKGVTVKWKGEEVTTREMERKGERTIKRLTQLDAAGEEGREKNAGSEYEAGRFGMIAPREAR